MRIAYMADVNTRYDLPDPTKLGWDAQIHWIFKRAAHSKDVESITQKTIADMSNVYTRFIEETHGNEAFLLKIEWDLYSLFHWHNYLLNKMKEGIYAPKTVRHLYNTVAIVMRIAKSWGLIEVMPIKVPLPSEVQTAKPKTQVTTAFEIGTLAAINRILGRSIYDAHRYSKPYQRQNIGVDPRTLPANTTPYGSWENMVWCFENLSNCKPMVPRFKNCRAPGSRKQNLQYMYFDKHARKHHGGIDALYEKLGILNPTKHGDVIFQLTMALANQTGFNVEVLAGLTIDCYCDEHELTKAPYISYYKGRSGGAKDLPITLFEDNKSVELESTCNEEIEDNEWKHLWLGESRAKRVKTIIELIKALTIDVREYANSEDKNLLIIYWVRNNKQGYQTLKSHVGRRVYYRNINSMLKPMIIEELYKQIDNKLSGKNKLDVQKKIYDKIMSENLSLNRFRASLASQLLRSGASLPEIQAFLGHARLSTTLRYIEQNDFQFGFYKSIGKYLDTIKKNATQFAEAKNLVIKESVITGSERIVYEAGICMCLNPWNPGENVKKTIDWIEGTPCRAWNRCLFCSNILITNQSLPKLIAYQGRLRRQIDSFVNIPPGKSTPLLRSIALIDEILLSDAFTENELKRARLTAVQMDYDDLDMMLVDGTNAWNL